MSTNVSGQRRSYEPLVIMKPSVVAEKNTQKQDLNHCEHQKLSALLKNVVIFLLLMGIHTRNNSLLQGELHPQYLNAPSR